MLTPKVKKSLVAKANFLQPILHVGKNGLSGSFLTEVALLAKKKGLIKIKLLKSFSDDHGAKATALEIADKTQLDVVSVVGNTAVFVHPNGLKNV